jgi:DNA-binding LacI/PurR family transcriptional regulator
MAADHLLERGLRNFAFCGYAKTSINGWSEEREKAFASYLEKKDLSATSIGVATGAHANGDRFSTPWALGCSPCRSR